MYAEEEKMLSGFLYYGTDKELEKMRLECKDLCFKYNKLKPSEKEKRVSA